MKVPKEYLAPLLLAVAVGIVFRSAMELYFAQDDFHSLALATGVVAPATTLWRSVSRVLFTDVLFPVFGLAPGPYHAAILALHATNAWLVYLLARRWITAPAALVTGVYFAVHPALFTALHWISARADVLATTFGLLTLLTLRRRDHGLWMAPPLFLLALLTKESLLLLPAVAMLAQASTYPDAATKDRLVQQRGFAIFVLVATSVLYALYLVPGGQSGVGFASETSQAYTLSFGPSVWRNLLTYVGWTVDVLLLPRPQRFVDAVDPMLFAPAVAILLVAIIASLRRELRARGWLVGVAGSLLLIAPVLFFENHTYRYYLYAPLLAASLCVGVVVDLALARMAARKDRFAWPLAIVACLVLVFLGQHASSANMARRSPVYSVLYGDPTVDRAHIARQMIEGFRRVAVPVDSDLSLILRERVAALARLSRDPGGEAPPNELGYAERNVRAAVLDGLGIRVMVPAVRRAEFVLQPPATWDHRLVVMYSPVGEIAVFDSTGFAEAWESDWIVSW